jgi:Transposase DDE domain/Domain of unknown function (DUF4372)
MSNIKEKTSTGITLVGQPILKQVLDLVDKVDFAKLVASHKSDHYYKAFKSWTHFATMMFGILSRCDSMAEVCDGMRAMQGKLNHLGLEKAPAKSSAGDGLRNRDASFFEALYYSLTKRYSTFLSDSRTYGLTTKDLFIVDSTTIRLFTEILKGVGRNPKHDGQKKGGLKVHMLIDAHQSIAKFVKITEAKLHDKNFLQHLILPEYSTIVFDKAYNHYKHFAKWTNENIHFVTRQKSNAVYKVLETTIDTAGIKGVAMVYREEIIEVSYKENKEIRTLKLKRVCYRDEKNRHFVFISNNLTLDASEIALIYKKRWGIELLFKKMKQNFQLHYFYGENENAIKTQVWCTLIAQLLLTVIQKKVGIQKAFSAIATLIRIHLISMLNMFELLKSKSREWRKKAVEKSTAPDLFAT